MHLTVSVGPGAHSGELVQHLAAEDAIARVIYSWPSLSVHDFNSKTRKLELAKQIASYRYFVHATWALWRKIPYWRRYQTPQAFIFHLYDRLASRLLGEPDIFLGWSQVSSLCLRQAKKRGAVAVLEHPMMHVDLWQSVMSEEYSRFGNQAASLNSLFSARMVRRMKREYEEADFIVVPSTAARNSFTDRGVPRDKLIRIPLGVDASAFHPAARNESSPFRVMFAGRLELLKGVHYLLQAWSELKLADAELWLVGPVLPEIGPFLERYADQTVRVIGEAKRSRMPDFYRQADALVFPSLNDGFGLVMLEAMASGIPVIATESTGGLDVITDEVNGFIIPIRDVEAIKQRVNALYADRDRRNEMGMRAREAVLAQFTGEHYRERLLSAYAGMNRRPVDATLPAAIQAR